MKKFFISIFVLLLFFLHVCCSSPSFGVIDVHDYVDLGLPSGLKWATCNVGASTPEGYGDYFAWGEVAPAPSGDCFQEYCKTCGVSTSELKERGVVGANYELTPKYDVATVNWGKGWRMPTKEEFEELLNNCDWKWTNLEGVNGYKVSSKENSNWIFLPAAGYCDGTLSIYVGSNGDYWSSTVDEGGSNYAYYLYFYSSSKNTRGNYRSHERTVRPVLE